MIMVWYSDILSMSYKMNRPTWDMDNGSVEDHKRRHKKVLVEMMLTIFVRFIIHAIMLVPIIFTGTIQFTEIQMNETF